MYVGPVPVWHPPTPTRIVPRDPLSFARSAVNRTAFRAVAAALITAMTAATAAAQDSATPPQVPTVAPGNLPPTTAAAAPVVPPYHVGRLAYDSHCMTIDGHDLVLFSGAFHYFRCPRPLWADRFRTLKSAGFNALETYVAWNYHERQPPTGPDDASKIDLSELHDWLEMATQQFGFQVILRPGPYICAEWDGGGYPQWLLTRRPAGYQPKAWLRSDEPSYLAWCKHWYDAVAKVAGPYQVTRQPAGHAGIVLWQIENEYDYSGVPLAAKKAQLDFLAHVSRDAGIDVPLMTCVTNNPAFLADPYLRANVVATVNSYPSFNMKGFANALDFCRRGQPEKFRMVTELQGGWFAQVGGKLSDQQGHNAAQINQITLLAYEKGFTVTNYYMAFGGTNFGDWASQGLLTTYDYNAPVREPGGTTDRYQAVRAIGQFVADHGPGLARSTAADPATVEAKVADPAVHVAVRRGSDGDYVFVRTERRNETHKGPLGVTLRGDHPRQIESTYDLGDFGAKVLFVPPAGEPVWYPKPQPEPKRPTDLPAEVTITDAKRTIDPGPTVWHPFDPEKPEQAAGIFDRQFVFYRAVVPSAAAALGADQKLGLSFDLPGKDAAVVTVEGHRVKPDGYGTYPVAGQTHAGSLSAVMLYENAGRPNFGDGLEQPSGLLHGRVTAMTDAPAPLSGWREHKLEAGHNGVAETAPDVDDGTWPAADVSGDAGDLQPRESAVYRATVTLTDAQAAQGRTLVLGSVDDGGAVYVNGQLATEPHDWSTPVRVDAGKLLHAGRNVVAVIVHNRENTGGLCRGATLAPTGKAMPVEWTLSQDGQGSLNHWYESSTDDSAWQSVKLADAPPADAPGTLLTWTRLRFELPTPNPHAWVPWRVTLDAGGNGFVYVNGHPLGRWWEAGPQHDFYLPECWLNFGPGQANVVTLALRPTDNAAVVRSAVVRPYAEQAEVR